TVWAQVVADQLGVDVADVEVISGDTRRFPWGVGTFASRGAVTAGNAMAVAAGMVAEKAKRIAADHLEADPSDLELSGGQVRVKGSPDRGIPLAAVAVLANPVRYAFGGGTEAATQFAGRPRPGPPLPEGEQPGLEATGYFSPPGSTWAAGCHAAYVRVDPKTFRLEILKYVVAHDCGRLINPLVVQGQIEAASRRESAAHSTSAWRTTPRASCATRRSWSSSCPTRRRSRPSRSRTSKRPRRSTRLGSRGRGRRA